MRGLLQRVSGARVEVEGAVVGAIDQGLLVLLAVEPEDTRTNADKLLHKLLNYRVFSDPQGKMNLSLADTGGGLLLVSQFTLAADTRSGLRPRFFHGSATGAGRGAFRLRGGTGAEVAWSGGDGTFRGGYEGSSGQ